MKAGRTGFVALLALVAVGLGVYFVAVRSLGDANTKSAEASAADPSSHSPFAAMDAGEGEAGQSNRAAADTAADAALIADAATGVANTSAGVAGDEARSRIPPTTPNPVVRPYPAVCPQDPSRQVLAPPGWHTSRLAPGGDWQDVPGAVLVATDEVWQGSRSARSAVRGLGPIFWQAVDATPYRGRRVEISASIHWPRPVRGGGGALLFVRTFSGPSLMVHKMANDRSDSAGRISDGWIRATVLIDVPAGSDVLLYGFRLSDAWMDEVKVSAMDAANGLPGGLTGGDFRLLMPVPPELVLPQPRNLGFEEPGVPVPAFRLQDENDRC